MKVFILTLPFIFFLQMLVAQESKSELVKYNWNENRPRYNLSKTDEEQPLIFLMSKTVDEYVFENNAFLVYSLEHYIIRVNNDEGIASANKIYISMYNTIDVVNIKARSISKEGKVINLDKNNIKEVKEDEEQSASKIFAIEGVEKGSEIEYFYVKKMYPSIYGNDIFQYSAPVKEAYFRLIAPDNLVFRFKSYNGYPTIKDSTADGKNIYTARKLDIPELKEETTSNLRRNQMRMEFKLAVNTSRSNKELYTWNEVAQTQYNQIATCNKKETKEVEKLYNSLNLATVSNVEDKIRKIENYLKTNFVLKEVFQDDYSMLDAIIRNKLANNSGIVKLYAALFKLAGIENQLVMTSERDRTIFDGSFESYRFLNNHLFYFPATNKFLSPEEIVYRYPLIPYNLTNTDALFFKTVKIGEFESFIPSVKFIPPFDYKTSCHEINVEIEFINNMSEIHQNLNQVLKGYFGAFTQPYYSRLPEDKKEKMLQDMMDDMSKDTRILSLTAENTDPNQNIIEVPFKVHEEVEGSSLLENAGNKVLLKIGEVIGKQVEMYQEKKRVMEVEDLYNREFLRKLKVKIPEGYTLKNADDVKMNHVVKKGNDVIYQFVSTYTINDNVLTIDIDEFYNQITCSVEMFDKYRDVVNAAADFNKVILVFEQKTK